MPNIVYILSANWTGIFSFHTSFALATVIPGKNGFYLFFTLALWRQKQKNKIKPTTPKTK